MRRLNLLSVLAIVLMLILSLGCLFRCNEETQETNSELELTTSTGWVIKVPEFLSREQQAAFGEAFDIATHFSISIGYFSNSDIKVEKTMPNGDSRTFFKCDQTVFASYDDFYNYLLSYYIKEDADSMLAQSQFYIEESGALYAITADRGTIITYMDCSYELVSKSDDEIKFNVAARYVKNPQKPDEGTTIKEYPITLLNTDNGWRFRKFDLWL